MKISLSDHFTYKRLLRFAIPSILMMIFTSIYSAVDGFFVSNYVGKLAFASINLIWPFISVLSVVGFMVGSGGSALVGKTLGEGNKQKANELFSMFVCFIISTGLIIMTVGLFNIKKVAILLGASEQMLPFALEYGRILLYGLPFVMLQFGFQSFYIVAEKPKLGLYSTLIAGFSNIILDFILVGILKFGIIGAAWATNSSQIFGGVIPLLYFSRKNTSLLRISKFRLDSKSLFKALSNGLSEFVSNISGSIVAMLYNFQLMKYAGQDGVSAYGVIMYVCFLFLAIYVGFAVGTAPLISFNYGAKNHKELKNILFKSYKILALSAILMFIAGETLSNPISKLFVGYDIELLALTHRAFRIYSFSFLFAFIPIYGSSFFTALNDGVTSAIISFLRTVVFQVTAVFILPLFLKVDGIWLSVAVAEGSAALVSVVLLLKYRDKYDY